MKVGGLFDYEPIPVLIGNTLSGDWIGMCPVFDIEKFGEEEIGRIQDNASHKIEYKPLISGLKNLETVEIFSVAVVQFPAPTNQLSIGFFLFFSI